MHSKKLDEIRRGIEHAANSARSGHQPSVLRFRDSWGGGFSPRTVAIAGVVVVLLAGGAAGKFLDSETAARGILLGGFAAIVAYLIACPIVASRAARNIRGAQFDELPRAIERIVPLIKWWPRGVLWRIGRALGADGRHNIAVEIGVAPLGREASAMRYDAYALERVAALIKSGAWSEELDEGRTIAPVWHEPGHVGMVWMHSLIGIGLLAVGLARLGSEWILGVMALLLVAGLLSYQKWGPRGRPFIVPVGGGIVTCTPRFRGRQEVHAFERSRSALLLGQVDGESYLLVVANGERAVRLKCSALNARRALTAWTSPGAADAADVEAPPGNHVTEPSQDSAMG